MIWVTAATDTRGLLAVASSTRRRAITAQALRAGARILRPAVKARAPKARVKGGTLKRAIAAKVQKGKYGHTVSLAVVGARYGPERPEGSKAQAANYGHLVELGTRPHSLAKGSKLKRVKRVKRLTRDQLAAAALIAAEKAELRARLTRLVAQGRIPADRLKSLGRTGPRKPRKPKKPNVDVGQDKGARHPGARKKPYLEPAYRAKRRDIGRATAAKMAELVQKEIAKQAARTAAKLARRTMAKGRR